MTQLSFSMNTPQGPVTVTASLTGLKTYEYTQEIKNFFDAITHLKCHIYAIERESEERESKRNEERVSYNEPVALEPVVVI